MQTLRCVLRFFPRGALIQRRAAPFSVSVMRNAAWTCDACAFSNMTESSICVRCEVQRESHTATQSTPAHLLRWKCACGAENGLLTCTCKQCGKEPPIQDEMPEEEVRAPTPSNSTTEQWVCFCGAKNPVSRTDCVNCANSTSSMAESTQEVKPEKKLPPRSAASQSSEFWTCSCGASNRAYRTECAVCGEHVDPDVQKRLLDACVTPEKPTEPEPKPRLHDTPDWNCPSCTYFNYGARLECRQCGRSKVGEDFLEKQAALDWTCAACSFSNFAKRTSCYRCHRSREHGGSSAGTVTEEKASSAGSWKSGLSSDDWRCLTCQYSNFRARADCRRCGTPKAAANSPSISKDTSTPEKVPAVAPDASSTPRHQAEWPCVCGATNNSWVARCTACLMKRPIMHVQPGDWVCPCGVLNYKFRNECFTCHATKKKPMFEISEALSCGPWKCGECNSPVANKATMFRCKECFAQRVITPEMQNWKCPGCSMSNDSERFSCRSCGIEKLRGKMSVKKNAKWNCACGNVNLASAGACLNCGGKRPVVAPEQPKVRRPWACPCGNTNPAECTTCAKCEKPFAKESPAKPTQQSVERKESKPTLEPTRPTESKPSNWVCVCGEVNSTRLSKCIQCGRNNLRVKVWYCVSCQTFNSCDSDSCMRCAESRAKSTEKLSSLSGWKCRCGAENAGLEITCHACALIRNCPYGQQMPIRPGDWRCDCEMVNKLFKKRCSHCRVARKLLEWFCRCGTMNSSTNAICTKCQSLPENGRWTCSCGFSNFAGRSLCHQCAKMRPGEDGLTAMVQQPEGSENRSGKVETTHESNVVTLKTEGMGRTHESNVVTLKTEKPAQVESIEVKPKRKGKAPRKKSTVEVKDARNVENDKSGLKAESPPGSSTTKGVDITTPIDPADLNGATKKTSGRSKKQKRQKAPIDKTHGKQAPVEEPAE